jgi:hypothetical protein
MPIYDMKNTATGEITEMILTVAKRQELLDTGEWSAVVSAPPVISQHGSTLSKTSNDWKNHLERINRGSGKGNTINT